MAARWVGALIYAVAAAAAAVAALAADGPLVFTQLRETAPLAALLGGMLGMGVNSRWPLRWDSAMATGFLTALAGLVFFSGLYLLGGAFIEAYLGRSATQAVADASGRLGARLPVAAPLTIGAFMLAGLTMWLLGALGRALFRRRAPAEAAGSADAAETAAEKSDPGAAGAA